MTDERLQQVHILKTLAVAGPEPMADCLVRSALSLVFPQLTQLELEAAIRSVEVKGWIVGVRDDLLGVVWSLTAAGRVRALQL